VSVSIVGQREKTNRNTGFLNKLEHGLRKCSVYKGLECVLNWYALGSSREI